MGTVLFVILFVLLGSVAFVCGSALVAYSRERWFSAKVKDDTHSAFADPIETLKVEYQYRVRTHNYYDRKTKNIHYYGVNISLGDDHDWNVYCHGDTAKSPQAALRKAKRAARKAIKKRAASLKEQEYIKAHGKTSEEIRIKL